MVRLYAFAFVAYPFVQGHIKVSMSIMRDARLILTVFAARPYNYYVAIFFFGHGRYASYTNGKTDCFAHSPPVESTFIGQFVFCHGL